ncbi:hypothetical protein FOL47_009717 [Perkinsus chesapeaki]|uniref:Uncharacterized protein n=1 Tax=Perkinsus chesapeaki TaxID=330153 RepID=A0A7J6L6M5_PERCH|nr:hypothetical protein FOL47_009717 [Perkinsus chesapeaki]
MNISRSSTASKEARRSSVASSSSRAVSLLRLVFAVVLTAWWIWIICQLMFSSDVIRQLLERTSLAFNESRHLASDTWMLMKEYSRVGRLWLFVVAPFFMDLWNLVMEVAWPFLREKIFPVFQKYLIPVARDYIWPFLVTKVWPMLERLPLDLRVAILWIGGVLMLRKLYPKAKHLTILPIAWFIWRGYYYMLPEKYVRIPMVVGATVVPLVESLRIYFSTKADSSKLSRDEKVALRGYLCYWAIFPIFLVIDYVFVTFLGTIIDDDVAKKVNCGYNAACLIILVWMLGYGGVLTTFDFARKVLWALMGQQVWVISSAVSKYVKEKIDEHGTLWKLGVYWSKFQRIVTANSRTLLMRLFTFAVWPWYMVETGKTVSKKAYWDYRPSLAFALLFLSTELLVSPRLFFPLSTMFNMAHMPIVFGLKYFGEFMLDSTGKICSTLFEKLKPHDVEKSVEKTQDSRIPEPTKRFGGTEIAKAASEAQERILSSPAQDPPEVELPAEESEVMSTEANVGTPETAAADDTEIEKGPRRSSRLSTVRQRVSGGGSPPPVE